MHELIILVKMLKIQLLSIQKSEFHSCYSFSKQQGFLPFLRAFCKDLGLNTGEFGHPENVTKTREVLYDRDIDISTLVDYHVRFSYPKIKSISLDLVFGKDTIFMILYTPVDRQQEIAKLLAKYT